MNMINVTRARKQILAAVERVQHATNSVVLDPKQALDTFMEAQANAMRATNVDEVLQMIRYSHQVREDLATLRRLRGLGIPCILALRKWDQELATHNEYEFRAFVHDNVLTGITQYNQSVFNREIASKKQQVQDMLTTFLNETVLPAVPHRTFIVDLFLSPSTNKIQIVGFNPFEATTCASLFDWRKDTNVLLNGPFQFRILDTPPAAMFDKKKGRSEDVAMEVIPPKWARILQADLGCLRYDEHFVHPSLDATGRPVRSHSHTHGMHVNVPGATNMHATAPVEGPAGLSQRASTMDATTTRDAVRTTERSAVQRGSVPSVLPVSRSAHASVGGGTRSSEAASGHSAHSRSHRHTASAQPAHAHDHPQRSERDAREKSERHRTCIIC
jgi:hypothetical protein